MAKSSVSERATLVKTLAIGDRFGHLEVVGPAFSTARFVKGKKRHEPYCLCQCDCGTLTAIPVNRLYRATVCSTYCSFRRPKPRGPRVEGKLYSVWNGMQQRCYNTKELSYRFYGARGVGVCQEWLDSYYAFEEWAFANGYQKGLHIDRIDTYGNYGPTNCRFVTQKENNRNRRTSRRETVFGETKVVAEWAEDPRCAVTAAQLRGRLSAGWEFTRALLTPSG